MPFAIVNGIYKTRQLNLWLHTGKRLCYTHLNCYDLYYNQKALLINIWSECYVKDWRKNKGTA